MSENDGKKTLGIGGARPANVKQSFSHGRTKNVVVETKRKRVVVPKPGMEKPTVGGSNKVIKSDPAKRPAGISDVEMERRLKALKIAKAREVEDTAKRKAEEDARAAERERRKADAEEKERAEREREERLKAKAEDEERKRVEAAAAETRAKAATQQPVADAGVPDAAPRGGAGAGKPSSAPRKADQEARDRQNKGGKGRDDGRRSGKLTLNQALSGDRGRQRSMAAIKRKQERARLKAMGGPVEHEKVIRDVQVPEAIVVSELAVRMAERVADVVKALMNMGMMVT